MSYEGQDGVGRGHKVARSENARIKYVWSEQPASEERRAKNEERGARTNERESISESQ